MFLHTQKLAKKMKIRFNLLIKFILLFTGLATVAFFAVGRVHADDTKHVRILFTHDIHSYVNGEISQVGDEYVEHGNMARLKTLVDEYKDENSVYLDGGDIAMGTLFQSGFDDKIYEMRLLGMCGCDVTTVGNHEWDLGGYGFADFMNSCTQYASQGEALPAYVQANLDFSGELTKEQQAVKDAMDGYGASPYKILETNGTKIAVFGVLGEEAISDSPTSGMKFVNYIDAAKAIVDTINEKEHPDLIVCLSHSGTDGDIEDGEDIKLAKEVPDIDVIISAHSHDQYNTPIIVGDTILVSAKCYLYYLGCLDVDVKEGVALCTDYKLIPIDEKVKADREVANKLNEFKNEIEKDYLEKYGFEYDEVLCSSDFATMSVDEMYAANGEFNTGNLIADSYMYAAKKNGVSVDVAAVGLGTIRDNIVPGEITAAKAFEICSLGKGSDGSAGHPLVVVHVTGRELRLIAELDASLGDVVSSIRMSYSGLKVEYNDKRAVLDKVTSCKVRRDDGTWEEIDKDKIYTACVNVYAANMIGMVNGLSKGTLKIVPKMEDGTPVEDIYDCVMLDKEGNEVKEWVAFADYISSFEPVNGVAKLPDSYRDPDARKVKYEAGGLAVFVNPGVSTHVICGLAIVISIIIVLICKRIVLRIKRKNNLTK